MAAVNEKEPLELRFSITPEMREVIDDLVRRDGTSEAAVMRKAIAALKTLKDAQDQGNTPAIIGQDGSITRIVGA